MRIIGQAMDIIQKWFMYLFRAVVHTNIKQI
jgi:hypothetical protein